MFEQIDWSPEKTIIDKIPVGALDTEAATQWLKKNGWNVFKGPSFRDCFQPPTGGEQLYPLESAVNQQIKSELEKGGKGKNADK